MNMMRKSQIKGVTKDAVASHPVKFISEVFRVAA